MKRMEQVTKCQSHLSNHGDIKIPNYCIAKSVRNKKILNKALLVGIMVFGVVNFSFAQNGQFKNASYRQDLLNDEHEATARIRTEKQDISQERKELREDKSIVREISDIPSFAVERFKTNFPKAKNVHWLNLDGVVRVDFTLHGKHMINVYNFKNKLVGNGKYLSYESLPARARKQITRYYKKYIPESTMYYNSRNESFDMSLLGMQNDERNDYYVLMKNRKNAMKEIVLRVSPGGDVSYFRSVPQNA